MAKTILPIINVMTEKTEVHPRDLVMIEDYQDSNAKKKVEVGNLMGVEYNDIGVAGQAGFGVGLCPPELLPTYIIPLEGYTSKTNDNYGNYKCTIDNSIMVWIPAFWFNIVHDGGSNVNKVNIKSYKTYATEAEAIAQGYQIHRMFIDGGVIKEGVFVDKYEWSLTNFVNGVSGVASSIKNGNPISSQNVSKRIINGTNDTFAGSFSNCISNGQTPADNYGGAWSVAKSRGNDFSLWSIFVAKGLALLSLAHGQAVSSTANCAWYHATNNFPKGNNNYGADINDATCTFTACDDGYWASRNEARKTGSGNIFAKTTHNGQNCGVADLNGNQWKIMQGITTLNFATKTITAITRAAEAVLSISSHGYSNGQIIQVQGSAAAEWNTKFQYKFCEVEVVDAGSIKLKVDGAYVDTSALSADYVSGLTTTFANHYLLKESVSLKNVTGGNSLTASDHFNSTFVNNNFDQITLAFAEGGYAFRFGNSTNQVLGFNTDRTHADYKKGAAGLALAKTSVSGGGSNQFGADYYYQWFLAELCALSGGSWYYTTYAGVWYLSLANNRTTSARDVSARACLYV